MRVLGVYVGRPAVLGHRRGKPVRSAIAKQPVASAELMVRELNLDGDDQADRIAHGGPDKAVYVYPAAHYDGWRADGFDFAPGGVGENVSVAGPHEHVVRIGDRWQWGEAELTVTQPRSPCYKLGIRTGRPDVIPAMIESGRTGWYLRVTRPGRVPVTGAMRLLERRPDALTVAEAFAPLRPDRRGDRALLARVAADPMLAEQWRAGVRNALRRAG